MTSDSVLFLAFSSELGYRAGGSGSLDRSGLFGLSAPASHSKMFRRMVLLPLDQATAAAMTLYRDSGRGVSSIQVMAIGRSPWCET